MIDGRRIYGQLVEMDEDRWYNPIPGAYLISLSQEHGILKITPQELHYFKPGNLIEIIPVHSCLTANLMKEYLTAEGEIIKMLPFY